MRSGRGIKMGELFLDSRLTDLNLESAQTVFGSPSDSYGIVVFSHLRWKFVWQRPQQFLSRFAANHPVLFMELTEYDLGDDDEPVLELETVAPNVTMANLHLPIKLHGSEKVNELMRTYCRIAIEAVNVDGSFDNPLLWYYSPMDVAWSMGYISGRGIVYDCMDELSQFRGAPPELVERERQLMQQADIVFTGGYELWLKKKQQHPNVHFFGCGVEYDHFHKATNGDPLPKDVQALKRPIVGWFGVVDERVDYDLLAKVAELRPDYSFVLVGPVVKVDPATLPQAPNIHWLGGRDYKVLPDYCRAYDVCMMCFALNEATQYINPTKALEYLATGKPVVGTPVNDVVRQYSDTVLIGKTPDDFAELIDRALLNPDREMLRRGDEMAQEASWESTVEKMQILISNAIRSQKRAYIS
jgi:glycosyltransferase involved in cell wall biosynthesis